jgi:hypothetical protein
MGVLGGVPHGQDAVLRLVVGDYATRLQRHWCQALDVVALPDDVLGLRQGRSNIATGIERAQGNIRPQLLVHEGRILVCGL